MANLHALHAYLALVILGGGTYIGANTTLFNMITRNKTMFDVIRELAYGLKLGARHAIDTRHNMTERAMRPSVSAALKDGKVGADNFGR